MELIQLKTQWTHDSAKPRDIGLIKNATWDSNRGTYIADGWRVKGAVPALDPAYTRISGPVWVQDPEDPEAAVASVTDRPTSEIEAEAAAAQAAAEEQALLDAAEDAVTPQEIGSPIKPRYLVLGNNVLTTTDEGIPVTFQFPVDKYTLDDEAATAVVTQVNIVDTLKAMKTEIKDNIAAAQAVDKTVFTDDQRTQFNNLRLCAIQNAKAIKAVWKAMLNYFKNSDTE